MGDPPAHLWFLMFWHLIRPSVSITTDLINPHVKQFFVILLFIKYVKLFDVGLLLSTRTQLFIPVQTYFFQKIFFSLHITFWPLHLSADQAKPLIEMDEGARGHGSFRICPLKQFWMKGFCLQPLFLSYLILIVVTCLDIPRHPSNRSFITWRNIC